jgi:hypothetical protein
MSGGRFAAPATPMAKGMAMHAETPLNPMLCDLNFGIVGVGIQGRFQCKIGFVYCRRGWRLSV